MGQEQVCGEESGIYYLYPLKIVYENVLGFGDKFKVLNKVYSWC